MVGFVQLLSHASEAAFKLPQISIPLSKLGGALKTSGFAAGGAAIAAAGSLVSAKWYWDRSSAKEHPNLVIKTETKAGTLKGVFEGFTDPDTAVGALPGKRKTQESLNWPDMVMALGDHRPVKRSDFPGDAAGEAAYYQMIGAGKKPAGADQRVFNTTVEAKQKDERAKEIGFLEDLPQSWVRWHVGSAVSKTHALDALIKTKEKAYRDACGKVIDDLVALVRDLSGVLGPRQDADSKAIKAALIGQVGNDLAAFDESPLGQLKKDSSWQAHTGIAKIANEIKEAIEKDEDGYARAVDDALLVALGYTDASRKKMLKEIVARAKSLDGYLSYSKKVDGKEADGSFKTVEDQKAKQLILDLHTELTNLTKSPGGVLEKDKVNWLASANRSTLKVATPALVAFGVLAAAIALQVALNRTGLLNRLVKPTIAA